MAIVAKGESPSTVASTTPQLRGADKPLILAWLSDTQGNAPSNAAQAITFAVVKHLQRYRGPESPRYREGVWVAEIVAEVSRRTGRPANDSTGRLVRRALARLKQRGAVRSSAPGQWSIDRGWADRAWAETLDKTVFPAWLAEVPGDLADLHLMAALHSVGVGPSGIRWAHSQGQLCRMLGFRSAKTLRKRLGRLEDLGLITRTEVHSRGRQLLAWDVVGAALPDSFTPVPDSFTHNPTLPPSGVSSISASALDDTGRTGVLRDGEPKPASEQASPQESLEGLSLEELERKAIRASHQGSKAQASLIDEGLRADLSLLEAMTACGIHVLPGASSKAQLTMRARRGALAEGWGRHGLSGIELLERAAWIVKFSKPRRLGAYLMGVAKNSGGFESAAASQKNVERRNESKRTTTTNGPVSLAEAKQIADLEEIAKTAGACMTPELPQEARPDLSGLLTSVLENVHQGATQDAGKLLKGHFGTRLETDWRGVVDELVPAMAPAHRRQLIGHLGQARAAVRGAA